MGHYYRHPEVRAVLSFDEYLDRSEGSFYANPIKEREANQFAEVVLFGNNAFAAAWEIHRGEVDKLTRLFGVSERVIMIAKERYLR